MKGNHASATDMLCLMNYACKYEVLVEVMNKAKHQCEVFTFDF